MPANESSPLVDQRKRASSQCCPDCFEIADSMLSARTDIAHDLHVILCAVLCSETPGNLLLYFAEPDTPFCFIVRERYIPVCSEAQNICFIVPESFQKADNLSLTGTAAFPFYLFRNRVFAESLLEQIIVSGAESAPFIRRKSGFAKCLSSLRRWRISLRRLCSGLAQLCFICSSA